jgi:acylphosphatase
MTDRMTRRIVVHGRVQGVGFRESLRQQADAAGVAGWVRNRQDGTVEAVLHGDAPAVEAVLTWASRGPPAALVESLDVEPAEGEYTAFEHRPTA